MDLKSKIIPAILTNNISALKKKLKKIREVFNSVHIDIVDGKFAKNVSIGLDDLKKIKFPKNLEIHLMVLNPEKYFQKCKEIGAKRVFFHVEAVDNPLGILKKMKNLSLKKGLALNPKTKIEKIKPYLKFIDALLILGVKPGFQGQKFNQKVLPKIKKLKKISKIKVGLDGGVNDKNIKKILKTEADFLVVGSFLFKRKSLKTAVNILLKKIL